MRASLACAVFAVAMLVLVLLLGGFRYLYLTREEERRVRKPQAEANAIELGAVQRVSENVIHIALPAPTHQAAADALAGPTQLSHADSRHFECLPPYHPKTQLPPPPY
ncbi:hypothetical protein GGH99_002010, partial [Coemansia sp. RSA 1285]